MDRFLGAVVFALLFVSIKGHGRLVDPPSRNAMWRYGFPNPPNYSDNQLNCGGFSFQWNVNQGKCGVCGDPYGQAQPHIYPGKYANNIITKMYKQGQVIDVKVEITANHKGYFTFTIGDIGRPPITEEKLNHVLKLSGSDGSRYYLSKGSGSGIYHLSLQLPRSLVCAHCVLRWWYTAGNSWGSGANGAGVGEGAQETFVNCADVRIISNSSTIPTSSSALPKKTTNPPKKTSLPTTGKILIKETPKHTTVKVITPKATVPMPTGENCRATPAYAHIPTFNWWCRVNCPRYCPKSKCICTNVPKTTTGKITTTRKPKPITTKSSTPVTTEPKPSGENCRATPAYAHIPTFNWWCRVNCPRYCPKYKCICTTPKPEPKICRSAGAYKGQPGMDSWCGYNCPSFCPKSHCSCS